MWTGLPESDQAFWVILPGSGAMIWTYPQQNFKKERPCLSTALSPTYC